jgi:hypothetical protein
MKEILDTLLEEMRLLEQRILAETKRKEQEFFYAISQGKVRFTEKANTRNKLLARKFLSYLRGSTFWVLATTPIIWCCLIPIVLIDVTMMAYQAICFPIYGIPKIRRRDYILLDRRQLAYLNWAEKLNCEYCGYANGVLAGATEIAARTEQYWCPIKHALRMKSMHSRYRFFFDYGDADHYRQQLEQVRKSFEDIEPIPTKPGEKEKCP